MLSCILIFFQSFSMDFRTRFTLMSAKELFLHFINYSTTYLISKPTSKYIGFVDCISPYKILDTSTISGCIIPL